MNEIIIPVETANGTKVFVQATQLAGEQKISGKSISFSSITESIKEVSSEIINSIEIVKPKSAKVEIGFEIVAESGAITAMLVKGTGTASLKITFEW